MWILYLSVLLYRKTISIYQLIANLLVMLIF
ncbi:uncharacterized protein METZ01_LOCUS421935, partial [marine metagenome]